MATSTSGSTGEICEKSGEYYCKTHTSHYITMDKGDKFPPCTIKKDHGTTWYLG